ncbi:MAG: phenylacetate-CoA oxygenase subunit PaaI [Flavobacteriales bacterium]|nr:MAG: phenylacetate-CoA oxygenase subunit PaaI [Flavobacteriales bacterium]
MAQASEKYVLRLADNILILGQRLGEWCGHGPVLEQDIALTNIALDLIGQSRMLYQYAAEIRNDGSTEDDLAMKRDVFDYYNCLLVEQPNGDWGKTIVRQFFFDTYHYYLQEFLVNSSDQRLSEIARKSFKEVAYHAQYSAEWVIRLGDGTEESHQRVQSSVNDLWTFTGELFTPDELDREMQEQGIGPDLDVIAANWNKKVNEILEIATLQIPEETFMQSGGKQGEHGEYLGFILAELQFMQRAYPDMKW